MRAPGGGLEDEDALSQPARRGRVAVPPAITRTARAAAFVRIKYVMGNLSRLLPPPLETFGVEQSGMAREYPRTPLGRK